MRQPQVKKLSELIDELRIAAENVAPIAPIAVAACWKLPIKPRRPRRVLDQEGGGAAPFAAGGEALAACGRSPAGSVPRDRSTT